MHCKRQGNCLFIPVCQQLAQLPPEKNRYIGAEGDPGYVYDNIVNANCYGVVCRLLHRLFPNAYRELHSWSWASLDPPWYHLPGPIHFYRFVTQTEPRYWHKLELKQMQPGDILIYTHATLNLPTLGKHMAIINSSTHTDDGWEVEVYDSTNVKHGPSDNRNGAFGLGKMLLRPGAIKWHPDAKRWRKRAIVIARPLN